MSDPNDASQNPDTDQDPEAPPLVPEARASALQAEVNELKDRVLRTLAEMENLRRRTERDVTDARQYSVTSFAREMLTVGDNLKRAIAAVPKDARAADPALSNLMDGVEATERGLEQTFGKFGIKQIEAKGEKFDPDFHQAMYEVENPAMVAGTVTEVVQPGYKIGDRVLRPALVAIAKGGPKTAPAEAADAKSGD